MRWLPAVLAIAALTGCVGPAPTTGEYEEKAAHTAADALSQLQTARLAVGNAGRMPASYLETVLVDAEEAFGSIESTFDSIQPPDDPRADRLRSDLDGLLSDGSDGMTQLRVLARRSDAAGLRSTAEQLVATADGLGRFAREHGS
ncbi:MAG TPA: hypothetical protein VI357_24755 [Mycobacteriales bacterium]